MFKTFVEAVTYFNLFARYSLFHIANLLSNSSKVINSPSSMR